MTRGARYLLTLYIAEQDESAPIAPGKIAESLDRSPAATTEMFQRLEDRGLVTHEPYEGAALTAEGRETAEELYDTYTVLSRFFRDVLELDDHEEEARTLAANISPIVADRLAATLPLNTELESKNSN